jgi:hypothetical protein
MRGEDRYFVSVDHRIFRIVPDETPTFCTRGKVYACYAAEEQSRAMLSEVKSFPVVGYAVCYGESSGEAAKRKLPYTCWYHRSSVFFRIFSLRRPRDVAAGGVDAEADAQPEPKPAFMYESLPQSMCIIERPTDISRLNALAQGESCGGPANLLQNVVRALGGQTWSRKKIATQEALEEALDQARLKYVEHCRKKRLSSA